jgi:DNA replication and repair protein RecF
VILLEEFILTNFKNYAFQRLECAPGLNGFAGRNGMGKTNLLDAIYYLCMGKSYFQAPDMYLARHDTGFFRLEGHFKREGRLEKIVAKVQVRKKKELERNDARYEKLSEHVGLLPVVFIAPDDAQLIQTGSEERRRFLDNTLCQIDAIYLQRLIAYQKALKQRNALLKQLGEKQTYQTKLIEAYDRQMDEPARYLHQRRAAFVEQFRPILRQAVLQLSEGGESVDCHYESELNELSFEALMEANRDKDQLLERTCAGPHRDDLRFTLAERPLKKFGSQGQLKSFLIALKLGQYELLRQEKQAAPLLLLDDIFDKLDPSRVEHLLRLMRDKAYGQIFITDTDRPRLENLISRFAREFRIFQVENGQVAES